MTIDRVLLLRTIRILEKEASALYDACTYRGEWRDAEEEQADYMEMIAVAAELRREAGHG